MTDNLQSLITRAIALERIVPTDDTQRQFISAQWERVNERIWQVMRAQSGGIRKLVNRYAQHNGGGFQ